MEIYGTDFEIAEKSDQSPVTEADARAEVIILSHLKRLAPEIPVIAEEAHSAGVQVEAGRQFFLVDPLDGTREFVNRRDEFTVNIALIQDGKPTLGVVFAPAIGRMFKAAGSEGAVEIAPDGGVCPVTARKPPSAGQVAVASRSHRDTATESYLENLGITEFVTAGSSLKFCLLAAGEADIYPRFGPTCEWDTAAGHAVLLAAGGGMSTLDGQPFVYGKTDAQFRNPGFLAWGGGIPAPPAH